MVEVRVRESIPLTPMREIIAKRMVESLQTMAQVTLTLEAIVDGLVATREDLLRKLESLGLRVTYTDILVKVVAGLLREHPYLNATLEEDRIKILDEVNIGVAVAIDHGLIVPVVKNVDKKRFEDIVREIRDLVTRAREGTLTPDDVSGGTFTITNLGMFDIDAFTPIINPPEVAILGVGRIQRKPVVVGDEIKIANVMWLSLTFDHRVVDGHVAARFLQELAKTLNDKEKILKLVVGD
jgi:pyruvate dehydrogenase E2 component (dihydrolipoamide acetyltransferase)